MAIAIAKERSKSYQVNFPLDQIYRTSKGRLLFHGKKDLESEKRVVKLNERGKAMLHAERRRLQRADRLKRQQEARRTMQRLQTGICDEMAAQRGEVLDNEDFIFDTNGRPMRVQQVLD